MNQQFREFVIDVHGPAGAEPIAVLERSTGDHPFVAFHGITAVNRLWFWDVLWPFGNVLLAGLPGHGPLPTSAAANWCDWTPEHFIDVGIAAVHTLTQGRPMTLIGHSTGGMIALGIAQQMPELVQRLILVSPVVWYDLTGVVGMWQRLAWSPPLLYLAVAAMFGPGQHNKQIYWASLRSFLANNDGFYGNNHVAQAIREGYDHMRRTPIEAIAGVTRVLSQTDLRPNLRRAPPSMPTLLIHGERDPVVPFAQAQWLAQTLPQIDFFPVPGVGHLPYGEQEAMVNQKVDSWLKQNPLPAPTAAARA
ncbi:MAG: alpha/beta hydrolase [Oscillochloris sp.]|nr:alpha/beta hydrolase [Oscillochloris sp.]